MLYSADITTSDGGRTVTGLVVVNASGRTFLSLDFAGPLRATRALAWAAKWAERADMADLRAWRDLALVCQI